MDGLERLRVFARAADLASFSATARALGLAQSQVSRAVRAIEDEVGASLFLRTTRAVSLTAEGRRYLEAVRAALASLEIAGAAVRDSRNEPSGTLRVTAPAELAEILGPVLGVLAIRHPLLGVDAVLADRIIDVVAEGFDVAIRTGDLPPTELRARKIGATRSIVCASPAHVARHGAPRLARDLRDHEVAIFSRKPTSVVLLQRDDGRRARIPLRGRLRLDDLRAVRAVAIAGAAIAILPEAHAAPAIASGALVRLLPRWTTSSTPIHALVPPRDPQPARVRLFIDELRKALRERPLLSS